MAKKKTREAKDGELRAIRLLETLQRFFSRPESRMDAQSMILSLSPAGQAYARHLVMSGPMENKKAAKECQMSPEDLEKAIAELQRGLDSIRA